MQVSGFLMLKNATDFSQVPRPIQVREKKKKKEREDEGKKRKTKQKTQKCKDFENKDAELQGSIYSILPAVEMS